MADMDMDLSPAHLRALHLFDWALAEGPDYARVAAIGAAAGAGLSLLFGSFWDKGTLGHALKYAAVGGAGAALGASALFAVGRAVSERSHEALAASPARGAFGA